jgi:hypothetical protein
MDSTTFIRTSKYFGGIVLSVSVLLGFVCSSAGAQTNETPDSVRFKVLGCLYRSIGALNSRNVRFKALQDELEDMHPIEPQSMDSAHFVTNRAQVTKYLAFLETHRSQLSKNMRLLSDTIHLLEQTVTKEEERKALADFFAAYKDETAAFILYSQYLSVMLTDIRHAIEFLQTVPMERKGNDIAFNTDRSANDKYMDYESKISAERMKVDEAIDRSIKLTDKENKIIQETLSLFNR